MKNQFTIDGDTASVELLRGEVTLVDAADLEILDRLEGWWRAHWQPGRRLPYVTAANVKGELPKTLRLHRVIMAPPDDLLVDHINHDSLDNRRRNLRIVTSSENLQNLHPVRANNTSGYRGVCYFARYDKWLAYCAVNKKRYYFGYHETPELAAEAAAAGRLLHLPNSNEATQQRLPHLFSSQLGAA